MAQDMKYSSSGRNFHSAGYKPGNMAAFMYGSTKRIWENDIVRIKNSMDEGIGNIEFYGGMWYVDGEPSNSLHDIVEYDDGELEVIGNIFDTLELLKGE